MDTLRVANDYSFLITEDTEVKRDLWSMLRFPERNYFHSRLYKQKLWDGYTDYFNKESGKFLSGLLPEVRLALDYWGFPYQIEDHRGSVQWAYPQVDEKFLNQFLPKSGLWPDGKKAEPFDLYDYQIDFINRAIIHSRGIVFSPTSSGKTNIMVGTLRALPENVPTLVLANATDLSHQNYSEITKWGFKSVGRVYGKYFEPNIITCANIQSAHRFEPLLKHIRVLIVDEIHAMLSKVPKSVYKKLKKASVRIGLSATPFKFGGSDKSQVYCAKGFFGPVLKTDAEDAENGILSTKTLQKRGILAKSNCTFYNIREPDLQYELYQDAVTKGMAQSTYLHDVVSRLAKKQTGRTLVLVERIEHGDALAEMIPGALWVRGEDNLETRNWVKEQLKTAKGNVVAIATKGIFNTGINVFIHNLINASGGKAEHQVIQLMGRGLRTAEDKGELQYYDFWFKINEYLESHSRKRVKILKEQGHPVVVKDIDF